MGRKSEPLFGAENADLTSKPLQIQEATMGGEKLKGWANIAKHMGQSTSTVQHWAKSGMPVLREGRSVVASPEELNLWLSQESGRKGAQIATGETDLSALLRHGLKDARASGRQVPAKSSNDKLRRLERKPPDPKPTLPPYSPVLPISQVESRISGLEKRIEQLEEIMKSMGAAEKRKTTAEIQNISSAVEHYRDALAIEKKLAGITE